MASEDSEPRGAPARGRAEAFERAQAVYERARAALERVQAAHRLGQYGGPESAEFSARAREDFEGSRGFHRDTRDAQADLGERRRPATRLEVVPPWPGERE
jgi:hypothetical protein